MSPADVAAHEAASYVRKPRTILAEFPAGAPRGSWPAEEAAAELTRQGRPATVRQVIDRDVFIVVPEDGERS